MSLLAPRPTEERASMVLPTITCSSCSAPIPLSSMGEHICRPSFNSTAPRALPRPAQIAIPAHNARAGPSSRAPVSAGDEPSPSFTRPYANSSSSLGNSPASLNIPLHIPSPSALSPRTAAPSPAFGGPSPSPSPNNHFFPHTAPPQQGTIVHGLGLGIGSSQGPYPTDAPLPAGIQDPMAAMPNTMSGGGAGMAGVGRRAFAAAAWGVRAGVALAQTAAKTQEQPPAPMRDAYPQAPSLQPQSAPLPRAELLQQQRPPQQPWPQPRANSGPREPPLLPKAPLTGRQRSGTVSTAARPEPVAQRPPSPQRAASAMSRRSIAGPSRQQTRKESIDSTTSSQRSGGGGDSIAQLLKARAQGEREASKQSTRPFFDRVKQLTASSSGSITANGTASPMMGFGPSRRGSRDEGYQAEIVESPQQVTFDLYDEDELGQRSALPWATPALGDSPQIRPDVTRKDSGSNPQYRRGTAGSESGSQSTSSSRSGRYGRGEGSAESDEVVTPSQSWEGLADRAAADRETGRQGLGIDVLDMNRDILEQIGEEEEDGEGERVVFGALSPKLRRPNNNNRLETPWTKHSNSSSIASHPPLSAGFNPLPISQPAPPIEVKRSTSSATSSTECRRKRCVKCGDSVGGAKRFVERDGVVLCEKDWKKLYLPSCRRCKLPIEKSAVSSLDGQLKGKWHRKCFTCSRCDQPFEGDSFYVHNGQPWCQLHYHEENGTLCASPSCRQPIEGPCILTPHPNPQRFHPGHLRCDHRGGVSGAQTCREPMDEYYEVAGGRYCERHVGEAMRKDGRGDRRAEKRRTRLVDLPVGGL